MSEENIDEDQTPAGEPGFEELFLDEETPADAPDLDLTDEDVFDLELDPEFTRGLFASPGESAVVPAVEMVEEPVEEDYRDGPRHLTDSELFNAPAPPSGDFPPIEAESPPEDDPDVEFVPPARSWPEKALFGLLAVNALLIAVLLVVPEVFLGFPGADPAPTADDSEDMTGPVAGALSDPTGKAPGVWDETAMPKREIYESAQRWIGRGNYARATSILEQYLASRPELTPLQQQAVFSSLMYCAQRLGDTERASVHYARVESLRRLAASPEDLWSEASEARSEHQSANMRQLYARLLLQQDRLMKRWEDRGRIEAAMTAFGDSYRFQARSLDRGAEQDKDPGVIR